MIFAMHLTLTHALHKVFACSFCSMLKLMSTMHVAHDYVSVLHVIV